MSEVQCTYRTIRELSTGIFKEKGSKFIALAAPCYSEEEAKQLLDQWRKEHHQARHLCYAYRLGLDKKIFRSNDDGEPNNSA
jgi:putative IMPACT (imprinted ancient) family translation regulator